jgi:3-methyladenine DNA glycosylase AlkD
MTAFAATEERLAVALQAVAEPARALSMAAYMRNQFAFLGVPTPVREAALRTVLAGVNPPTGDELTRLVSVLWARPEREYQYCACTILRRHLSRLDGGAGAIAVLESLVTAKAWWDTVDTLAAHIAGPLVSANPDLRNTMDQWITSENHWLARTAILHQLRFAGRTDADRLFAYCTLRAADREFFIRKAIGWALREYSKTNSDAVRAYVSAHPELSGLSAREALLWLNGGRRARAVSSASA